MIYIKRTLAVLLGILLALYTPILVAWFILLILSGGSPEGPVGGIALLALAASPLGILAGWIFAALRPEAWRHWHGTTFFMLAAPICAAIATLPVFGITWLALS